MGGSVVANRKATQGPSKSRSTRGTQYRRVCHRLHAPHNLSNWLHSSFLSLVTPFLPEKLLVFQARLQTHIDCCSNSSYTQTLDLSVLKAAIMVIIFEMRNSLNSPYPPPFWLALQEGSPISPAASQQTCNLLLECLFIQLISSKKVTLAILFLKSIPQLLTAPSTQNFTWMALLFPQSPCALCSSQTGLRPLHLC